MPKKKARNTRVLTDKQIEEGKQLRREGYSKADLAKLYGVGKTTIWENIFATQKRTRIYHKRAAKKRQCIKCANCEICLTLDFEENNIPVNLQVGNTCLSCYLDTLDKTILDIV